MSVEMPKLKMPGPLDKYDGTTDPDAHIKAYMAAMLYAGATDEAMCRAFPSTLKEDAQLWFGELKQCSISSFEDLAEEFSNYFATCKKIRRQDDRVRQDDRADRRDDRWDDQADRNQQHEQNDRGRNVAGIINMAASWTPTQNKLFEKALALYDMDAADRWQNVAKTVGKSVEEVKRHYEILKEDVERIEHGQVPFPPYSKNT
ncbi:Protein RADIALIS-like 1 [Senna tora]|uniref:Protein RADIALIS-like 1 n=1 Tax=Senna tora TaxID=362788 RepID=A0A834TUL9_9FABA|nr:Protein RADIALIS-like 1 [Senna tora]